jgi:hypothetical protein
MELLACLKADLHGVAFHRIPFQNWLRRQAVAVLVA